MKRGVYACIFLLTGLSACIESYAPNVISATGKLLVVEGVIQDTMTLVLSRTSGLGQSNISPEVGAVVWVENGNGTYKVFLHSIQDGIYTASLAILETDTYRLGIMTGNEEYYSEYVPVNNSPPIADVTWAVREDGSVEIHADTRNSNDRSRYYRWNFDETWEYQSAYESILVYKQGQIAVRSPDELIHRCYKSAESTDILISSTAALSDNVVSGFSLITIDRATDPRLDYRYSVLIRQYSMTADAFKFWQVMQKNTQNLGTLFGPQPSQLKSNIYCVSDAEKPVIGYLSAGNGSKKRIFISYDELPVRARYDRYPLCKIDTVANNPESLSVVFASPVYLPIASVGVYFPTGYMYATADCVDCRYAGGQLNKPDFW